MTAASLELLNTIASLTTTIIIGATALAAIVQLKHLRAGNLIAAQLALRQVLLDTAFWNAIGLLRFEVPVLMKVPEFRAFVTDFHTERARDADARFEGPYEAALVVGRNLENIGNMIRNGLLEPRVFLEQYANLVTMCWDACAPLLSLRRAALGDDTPWEDFEYLAVLARRFSAGRRSSYPSGMERILPTYAKPRD